MALDYSDSAALMVDPAFRSRVKVCIVKYSSSIQIEASAVAHHNARARWATVAKQQPDITAAQVQPGVVMDPAVQTNGAAITDTALQGAVEAEVNKSWI